MNTSARRVWQIGLLAVVLWGCDDWGWIDLRYQPGVERHDTGQAQLERIDSPKAWVDFFSDQISARQSRSWIDACGGDIAGPLLLDAVALQGQPAAPVAEGLGATAGDGGGRGGEEDAFTGTNIQEVGVDEADVVKSDGEYFYVLTGGQLTIVKAYPAEALEDMASLELNAEAYAGGQLYLNGNRIIAITEPRLSDLEEPRAEPASMAFEPAFSWYQPHTAVSLIDVTDKQAPQIEAEWLFDGRCVNSRLVDGMLHLVLNQFPNIPYEFDVGQVTIEDVEQFIPAYVLTTADGSQESGTLIKPEDFYRPVDADGYAITSVISLDTRELGNSFSSVAIMAEPGIIYASPAALYLTDPDYDYYCGQREDVDIHKFRFTPQGAAYVASGSVPGRLLNQFSLGEHEGNLRVATTTGQAVRIGQGLSENFVFVLAQKDDKLEMVGSIEGIAPGEQIYSARFIGEKGFLVTFRKVDPLFTLDLTEPENPRIVGELKITGYSDYIHFLDQDHLLTIGKAADSEGFYQGVQLSIFDVSNFSDPRLLVAREIGDRGTESEALHNHKAFTFYREQNLLAVPIDLHEVVDAVGVPPWPVYGEYRYSSLQIYHVTPEEGIGFVGQIMTHTPDPWGYRYYGWTRGMFIEDSVYALTEQGVKAADLSAPSQVLGMVDFESVPAPYPFYEGDSGPVGAVAVP